MSRPPVGSRSNNFDVLRLAAASVVLISHAFLLTGRFDPAIAITGGETLGDMAVTGFFGISGFLVARSWCREPHVGRFAIKRALRILPAFWAVLILSALVLGPLVSTAPLGQYLSSGTPWAYIGENAVFRTAYDLPGVFGLNPHHSVNGALWTLPFELQAYLAVAVLGILGAFRGWRAVALLAVVLLVLDAPLGPGHHALTTSFVSSSLADRTVDRLAAFFVAALLYVLRERGVVRGRALAALAVLWVAALGTSMEQLAGAVAIPYAVVFLAYRTPAGLGRLVRRGDLSYGIYLWGWPIEQTVRALAGPSIGPLGMILIAAPATYAAARLSWRLVEAPALRLKDGALRLRPLPARV